jgi:hypothetical protein
MKNGALKVIQTLISSDQIMKLIGEEPQPMEMNEELITDVIV